MDKGLTVPKWVLINRPKMPQNLSAQIGADSLAENTPNAPELPNLSSQAQKFWISMKKALLGIRSPWS